MIKRNNPVRHPATKQTPEMSAISVRQSRNGHNRTFGNALFFQVAPMKLRVARAAVLFVLGIIFMGVGALITLFRAKRSIERIQSASSVLDFTWATSSHQSRQ